MILVSKNTGQTLPFLQKTGDSATFPGHKLNDINHSAHFFLSAILRFYKSRLGTK